MPKTSRGGLLTTSTTPRVVYLGGLGRSGSTILERLLGELPGVCSAGELVHLWQRGIIETERCGCGTPFDRCLFWHEVGQLAFGGWDEVDVGRIVRLRQLVDRNRYIPRLAAPALRPAIRAAVEEYVGYYQRLYFAIANVSGSPTVVDSSKHASLAFCLRWGTGLDLRVVHVVRDSRAVAHSWARQVRRPDTDAASYMTTYSPVVAAEQWNAQNSALQLLRWEGVPTLLVRYEDLVSSPSAALTRIADFAGIEVGATGLSFLGSDGNQPWAVLQASHTASGNPMRFDTGRIAIRADERWRMMMPGGQRRTVTTLTLPLLARYGYLGRPA